MDAIAEKLGISKTTVHYAIRNTGRVSSAMRKKILSAAKQLGYRPDGVARSLRVRLTDTVGVVLVDLTSSFYAHLLEGIDKCAQEHQRTILLSCSNGAPEKEQKVVETLLERRVDGLIVVPSDPEVNRQYYQRLIDENVRLVFVDRDIPGINVDFVSTDHQKGAYLATRHLLQQGRRSILTVTTRMRESRSTSVQNRVEGSTRALEEANLRSRVLFAAELSENASDEEYGYQAIRHHLARSRARFDGIFAVHDGLAYGVIRALVEAGIRVPEDVAVVGFDDQDPSAYLQPPLTTVRQPMRQIGFEAMRLLFRRLAEDNLAPRQRLALEPQLIVRQSCGGPSTLSTVERHS